MAVRTPGDEASGLIGLGQGLERVFHLAAGGIGALGQWFKRLLGRQTSVPRRGGGPLSSDRGRVGRNRRLGTRNPTPPWEEVLGWAVGTPGFAVAAASIALILPWVLPGLVLSLFTGREAIARPAITGVEPSRCLSLSRSL